MNHLFANVKWKCAVCGKPPGCDCFVECECGRSYLRGDKCRNDIWHISKQFAEEAADLIVEDMAKSYKMFQRRGHIASRLKRAVIRQAQPIILATFEGVEAAGAPKERSNMTHRQELFALKDIAKHSLEPYAVGVAEAALKSKQTPGA